MMPHILSIVLASGAALWCAAARAVDVLEVSRSIDHHIEQVWVEQGVTGSAPCSDAEFVRRVTLDLVGRIPTVDELDGFLVGEHADKRAELVEVLLSSDEHAQHMCEVFDVVLMGRGDSKSLSQRREHGWHDYLRNAFAKNRPWNEVVREILLARPTGEHDAGSVWFLYERKNDYQAIAEAAAASIFGVQIDCAQCHDHMSVEEIEQRHYWGLVAFFNRGKNTNTKHGPRVAESAVGGFASFTNLSGASKDALLTFLGADVTIEEVRPIGGEKLEDKDELYISVDPHGAPMEPRIPKFSRRQKLVDEIVAGNPLVARAMVNRVWALLMGRGIVHPVDKMDSMHEPSHPELLDELTDDFVQHGYDVRRLIRAIVLSRTYQLDSRPAANAVDDSLFAWAIAKPLTAEQLYRSMMIAVDGNLDRFDESVLAEFRTIFPDVFAEENVSTFKQSLFLSNHAEVHAICAANSSQLVTRMLEMNSAEEQVWAAFAAALQRPPDEQELSECAAYLRQREDRRGPVAEQLVWALLTSAEFRLNH